MIPPPPRSPLFPYTTLFRSVVVGKSPQSIVVMAHRDDSGVGPGANENASGTAALIELARLYGTPAGGGTRAVSRSEEHTSELQSRVDLVCRLLLEKKKKKQK